MKSECFLSVIIPAFNEAARLRENLPVLKKFLQQSGFIWEVVLADDGSGDDTSQTPKSIFSENEFQVVRYEVNRGKGYAVKKGVQAARGEICLITDADFSYPIEEFFKLKTFIDQGYDIAIGSRAHPDSIIAVPQSWYRQGMGKGFNLFVKTLGLAVAMDSQAGFKCFQREKVLPIFSTMRIDRFCFDVELLFIAKRWGLKIREVPVDLHNCSAATKVHIIWSSLEMLRDLIRIRINAFRGIYEQCGDGSASEK